MTGTDGWCWCAGTNRPAGDKPRGLVSHDNEARCFGQSSAPSLFRTYLVDPTGPSSPYTTLAGSQPAADHASRLVRCLSRRTKLLARAHVCFSVDNCTNSVEQKEAQQEHPVESKSPPRRLTATGGRGPPRGRGVGSADRASAVTSGRLHSRHATHVANSYGPSSRVLSDISVGHQTRKHQRPGVVGLGSTPAPTGFHTRATRPSGPRHPGRTAMVRREEGQLPRRGRGRGRAAAAGGRPVAPHRSLRLAADAGQTRQQPAPSSDHSEILLFPVHVNFVRSRVGLSSAECNGVLGARRAQRCKMRVTRLSSPRRWRVRPTSRRVHSGWRRRARSPPPCSLLEVGLWQEYACRERTPPPKGLSIISMSAVDRSSSSRLVPHPRCASQPHGVMDPSVGHVRAGVASSALSAYRRPEHVAQQCAVYSCCCPHGRRSQESVRLVPPRVGRACTKRGD